MGAREAGGEESGGDREDEEGVSAVWFVVVHFRVGDMTVCPCDLLASSLKDTDTATGHNQ